LWILNLKTEAELFLHSMSAAEESTTGLLSFILSIDWYEPWLHGLIVFHVLCAIVTTIIIIFNRQSIQIVLFLVFLSFIYLSEYINEWAASNYRLFSKQQYFDSNGMFISLLFSTPLLLNCFVFVINWMYTSVQTMIKLKRAKLRTELKTLDEKNK